MTAFTSFHFFCTVEIVNAIKAIMTANSIFVVVTKSDRTNYSPAQLKFFKMMREITGAELQNPFKNYRPIEVLKQSGFEVDVQYFQKETGYTIETLKARARSFSGWCNMTDELKFAAEPKLHELVESLLTPEGLYSETTEEMCVSAYPKA